MSSWTRIVAALSFSVIALHFISVVSFLSDPPANGSTCLGCVAVMLERDVLLGVIALLSGLHIIHSLSSASHSKVAVAASSLALVGHATMSLIIARGFLMSWNSGFQIPPHLHCIVSALGDLG